MILKIGVLVALLSCPLILRADESAPPSFARGFEMLNALGLSTPDQNATWRKLDGSPMHQSNVLRELIGTMQGNGWLLPTTDGKPQMAISFGSIVPREARIDGSPPEGDLEKDTARIVEAIGQIERADDLDDFRRPWGDSGSRTFGPLMLFAAQLHQAGHPKLADQIAWALFQAAPTREVVIDAALDHLGNQLYQNATESFFKNHDWQAYRDELTKLIENLPRGWDAQPAAMLVLEAVNRRISQPEPPTPQLENLTIAPRALAAITWMTTTPESNDASPAIPPEVAEMLQGIPPEYHAQILARYGGGSAGNPVSEPGFWLIETQQEEEETPSPARELLALGIEAIPVLAALAADSYPTHFRNTSDGGISFSYRQSAAARALETYASMSRPATRGDIARLLLQPVLPDGRDQLDDADPNTIRDIAIEFYQTHKGKDAGKIAATYLADGDENQKSLAANFLATSTNPEHHRIFENHILNSSPATGNLPAIIAYTQHRKTAAKPLLDKFLPLIRAEVGDGNNLEEHQNLAWQFREPGQLNQTLRQLEAIADGKSLIDSAREIAAGPPEDAQAAIQVLLQNMASEPPDSHLDILLAGAIAAKDAQVRHAFLGIIFRIEDGGDEEDKETENSAPVVSESIREAWKVLVSDDRPIDPAWDSNQGFSADHLSAFAAIAIESRLHPGGLIEIHQAGIILKQTLADLCTARIKARIANEPVPALPDAEKVTEERLREIIATAATKSGNDIITYLDGLPPDERAAWAEWMADPEEIPLPETVRQLAFTLIEEDTVPQSGFTPTPGLLNLKPGFEIHEDTIDAYIAGLAQNSAEHSRVMGSLRQADFPPGLKSFTLRAAIPEKNDEEEDEDEFQGSSFTPIDMFRQLAGLFAGGQAPENAQALIICQLYSEAGRGHFTWWVIDGKPTAFTMGDDGEPSDEVTTHTFAKSIAESRQAGQPLMLSIQVLGREDAEKIANL